MRETKHGQHISHGEFEAAMNRLDKAGMGDIATIAIEYCKQQRQANTQRVRPPYTPTHSTADPNNPPTGGSGVIKEGKS